MTELQSPRTSPCWWLGTHGDKTVRAWARLATEAHALETDLLGYPHFYEVEWREDPDQSEHVAEADPEQAPTEPPPPIEPFIEWMGKDVEEAFTFALAAEDCYSKSIIRAVGMAREQLIEARHMQSEWLRERASLLEENARLRAEIQEWRTARRTDEIAVGYAMEEETDGL